MSNTEDYSYEEIIDEMVDFLDEEIADFEAKGVENLNNFDKGRYTALVSIYDKLSEYIDFDEDDEDIEDEDEQ